MAKYWIKLYHEILDDPKMGRLPDRLYRRVIELFLLAGDEDEGGYLPKVDDMAWRLRLSVDDLEADLQLIGELTGIVTWEGEVEGGYWKVTNFLKRQDADTGAERVSRYREAKRKEAQQVTNSYKPVTNDVTNAVQELELDKDIESEYDTLARCFETSTGCPIVPTEENVNAINGWVRDGITEAEIKDAIAYYSGNGRTARSPAQIDRSVRTAYAKRVQSGVKSQAVIDPRQYAEEVW